MCRSRFFRICKLFYEHMGVERRKLSVSIDINGKFSATASHVAGWENFWLTVRGCLKRTYLTYSPHGIRGIPVGGPCKMRKWWHLPGLPWAAGLQRSFPTRMETWRVHQGEKLQVVIYFTTASNPLIMTLVNIATDAIITNVLSVLPPCQERS